MNGEAAKWDLRNLKSSRGRFFRPLAFRFHSRTHLDRPGRDSANRVETLKEEIAPLDQIATEVPAGNGQEETRVSGRK